MRRAAVLAALALACVLVPQASAKGPIVLCGPSACAPLGSLDASVRWWAGPDLARATPAAPAPFLKLRFADHADAALAFWIPAADVLRSGPVWFRPTSEDQALLTQAAASLRPFAPPSRIAVTVDFRSVPRGDSSYLRLFTMGAPVASARTGGWLPVDTWGPESPWTCFDCLWISRAGAFLKRSDGTFRIPAGIADRVRHRLPLR